MRIKSSYKGEMHTPNCINASVNCTLSDSVSRRREGVFWGKVYLSLGLEGWPSRVGFFLNTNAWWDKVFFAGDSCCFLGRNVMKFHDRCFMYAKYTVYGGQLFSNAFAISILYGDRLFFFAFIACLTTIGYNQSIFAKETCCSLYSLATFVPTAGLWVDLSKPGQTVGQSLGWMVRCTKHLTPKVMVCLLFQVTTQYYNV